MESDEGGGVGAGGRSQPRGAGSQLRMRQCPSSVCFQLTLGHMGSTVGGAAAAIAAIAAAAVVADPDAGVLYSQR